MATTALDPQMKLLLDAINAPGAFFLRAETPEQARAKLQALFESDTTPLPEIYRTEDRRIPGPAGEIPIRIYTPAAQPSLGILVYIHGGGWVLGDLDGYDRTCRKLANAAGCLVIALQYRLAPEHKFPAGVEDCYAAVKWVADNAESLGGHVDRVAVGGDSAGGNLSAAVAMMARDRGGPAIRFQLLVYPVTDAALDTPSQKEFAFDGFVLSRTDMEWFWNHYLDSPADKHNPYASPLRAKNFANLPTALIITASHDPLRDEGERFGQKLMSAGNKVTCTRYDGVIHAFFSFSDALDQGKKAVAQATEALRQAFASQY